MAALRPYLSFALVLLVLLGLSRAPGRSAPPPGGAGKGAKEAVEARLKKVPVSIRCERADVALLLRGIGRQAGINIYVPEDLKETITLDFEDVTLLDLFNTILTAKGLDYEVRDGVLYIRRAGDGLARKANLVARRIEIVVGDAEDYVELLTPLLSPVGRIRTTTLYQNTNQVDTGGGFNLANAKKYLIVMDRKEIVDQIIRMVKRINRSIRQVYIQARIVMISKDAKEELGIDWGLEERGGPLKDVIKEMRAGGDSEGLWDTVKNTAAFNLKADSTLTLGIVRNALNLNAELKALQDRNRAKVLSAPRIMVLDGEAAVIKQGQEVPYVTTNRYGESNVEFKEAILSLSVIPTVLPSGYIVLQVSITNDSVSRQIIAGNYPLLNKQAMSTSLFLKDGVTVVIGGIKVHSNTEGELKVPVLGSIPLVGRAFKRTSREKDKMELLVFLTPHVVSMKAGEAWGSEAAPPGGAEPRPGPADRVAP